MASENKSGFPRLHSINRHSKKTLTRPQSSLIFSLIILTRDAGAGGDGKAKRTSSLSFPFLLPVIPCFISLPQLTPASLRDLGTTGDESAKDILLYFRRVYSQGLTQIRCFPRIIGLRESSLNIA